ncbi:C39 family peptidase [Anaerotignum sp. MB30-C6]|uniref:C39 family peptidase n=1 Tax=Anaerotignum sp. MB30-C6 TaxID=3070814 RepID=UPI0027DDC398|nr:C39 family peptidase [Anaerotignum sp. MB30-C6]WMI82108.1 C39 family peptidase [Anaerotignum sp. MB30-C6]
MNPVLYMQNDPKWASHDYSAPGEKTTIKAEGCGITCAAMVIATLADKNVTPITTAEWSKKRGYKAKGQGTYYSYFKPQGAEYGIEITMLNGTSIYGSPSSKYHELAKQAIERGDMVIACMGKGNWTTSGHYVLWYGLEAGKVLINDPWSNKPKQTYADYNLFKSQVKYYWVVKVPEQLKGDDEMVTREKIIIDGKEREVTMIRKGGTTYIKTRDIAELLGLKVGSKGRVPVIETR